MANTNAAHVVLSNVRLSYVHLDRPYNNNGNEVPKYSTTVLVPKSPPDNFSHMQTAIQAATAQAIAKHGAAFPAQPKVSVHDGDGVRPSDSLPFGEECQGCWVFTASSKQKPDVVDGNLQPIIDPSALYSGIYANVGVTFFGYNAQSNKGIGVALDNVQKIADGEPLGGTRAAVEDDFTPIVSTPTVAPYGSAPAPQYTQPQQAYGVPTQPQAPAQPGAAPAGVPQYTPLPY